MSTKEIAVVGLGVAVLGGLGYATKRFFQKRAVAKAITPEVKATAEKAVDLSRLNANNQLIASLNAVAEKKAADRSPLEAAFDSLYFNCNNLIDFDPRWKNGTDYFNGAMTVGLGKGNMAKSTGDCGRRIILIGTEHGTAVFFERYTIGHGPFVVVHNTASQLRDLIPNGSLDAVQFTAIVAALTV